MSVQKSINFLGRKSRFFWRERERERERGREREGNNDIHIYDKNINAFIFLNIKLRQIIFSLIGQPPTVLFLRSQVSHLLFLFVYNAKN